MARDPWPSELQRGYVKTLATYDPDLFATWRARLARGLDEKRLDRRTEELMISAVQTVSQFDPSVIERHIDEAFNAGANVAELLELMLRQRQQEGHHAMWHGGEALWNVIQRRDAAGLPTPRQGPPLTDADLIPHSPWEPAIFPYQTPHPRYFRQVVEKFAPERAAIDDRADAERAELPRQLSRRLDELQYTVVDAVIRYPVPMIDHHTHEALNCGSNVQEIIEATMVCAEAAQGARETNVAGRQVESGPHIIHYMLRTLDRVIGERDSAGVFTPREYGELPGPTRR